MIDFAFLDFLKYNLKKGSNYMYFPRIRGFTFTINTLWNRTRVMLKQVKRLVKVLLVFTKNQKGRNIYKKFLRIQIKTYLNYLDFIKKF